MGKAWTPEEDALLVALWPTLRYEDIARQIGRAKGSVMCRAQKMHGLVIPVKLQKQKTGGQLNVQLDPVPEDYPWPVWLRVTGLHFQT